MIGTNPRIQREDEASPWGSVIENGLQGQLYFWVYLCAYRMFWKHKYTWISKERSSLKYQDFFDSNKIIWVYHFVRILHLLSPNKIVISCLILVKIVSKYSYDHYFLKHQKTMPFVSTNWIIKYVQRWCWHIHQGNGTVFIYFKNNFNIDFCFLCYDWLDTLVGPLHENNSMMCNGYLWLHHLAHRTWGKYLTTQATAKKIQWMMISK